MASPPARLFPPDGGIHRPPNRMEVPRPHQTNKFWANWVSTRNREQQKQIFVMPYSLLWSGDSQDWGCHYYDSDQNNVWCQGNPVEGNTAYQYFAPGTAPASCGQCECCKHAIEVRAQLIISHQLSPQYHYNTGHYRNSRAGRMAFYISRFVGDYALGAVEQTSDQHYAVVREDLIGIHALVRGADNAGRTIRFPVYSGMAYVSGRYTKFTPRIESPQGYIKEVTKVQDGIWHFKNDAGDPSKLWECHYYENGQNDAWCQTNPILDDGHQKWEVGYKGAGGECDPCMCCKRPQQDPDQVAGDWGTSYRVYVLDEAGNFAAGDFHNTSSGFAFDRELNGWVRVAHVAEPEDTQTLDAHAPRILEGVHLDVETAAVFHYDFETSGRDDVELLHWAWGHQQSIMDFEVPDAPKFPSEVLTPLVAPTGGAMTPLLGTRWTLRIDLSGAQQLDFLLPAEIEGAHRDEVAARLNDGLINDIAAEACMRNQWATPECERPRTFLFTNGFYTNGKGLQKVAYYCLMSERLFGAGDQRTQTCIDLLARAFKCHYDPSQGCGGVPTAYYDTQWGGVAGRQGFHTEMCGLADFGNACYNDHHYHYGYFIVPAAALLKLRPSMAGERGFIDYINAMVRDTANPSTNDRYFPQFRAFDWYDMHSWSHGVTPSADGKDEESTSEDVNFYFGVQMWGRVTGNRALEQTGAMLLSLTAHTVKELFLMRSGNTRHHPDYVKNHVTGIFFQNKAHYGTFFGADEWFIHGVQMLPLSPALLLARTPEFCSEEWNDILSKINLGAAAPGWASLLLTGNLAIIDPNRAYDLIKGLGNNLDMGLSGAWAMYWAAALAAR